MSKSSNIKFNNLKTLNISYLDYANGIVGTSVRVNINVIGHLCEKMDLRQLKSLLRHILSSETTNKLFIPKKYSDEGDRTSFTFQSSDSSFTLLSKNSLINKVNSDSTNLQTISCFLENVIMDEFKMMSETSEILSVEINLKEIHIVSTMEFNLTCFLDGKLSGYKNGIAVFIDDMKDYRAELSIFNLLNGKFLFNSYNQDKTVGDKKDILINLSEYKNKLELKLDSSIGSMTDFIIGYLTKHYLEIGENNILKIRYYVSSNSYIEKQVDLNA